MSNDSLNEREFELINIIGAKLGSNQRDLSRQMDLSLGMVNLIIRRLISKGYIRIRQLNKRKVEYILTPKGFSEKMRKSVKYTLKTLSSIGLIRDQLKDLIRGLYKEGERTYYILGDSDLNVLVEWTFKDLGYSDVTIKHIKELSPDIGDGTVLIGKEETGEIKTSKCVDLIKELSTNHPLIANHIGMN